ncbi:metal-dependent hydrolase family protein [Agromyces aerolatus]|uniref:metal-dependent hydrolase family protein n=1 Tax=Agromyces sp. LY-1074 TaxID=3074080 RepID=UPI002857F42C|nr:MULTISPECIES: amidohydrolase family protein [unclassified Agromyces]MDR5701127.1 amidohydrolase family protein [Agromyces sp. LY-1074]MDR5707767.1 amidohydrolase family protein [Agromyces sp. LY-1358]
MTEFAGRGGSVLIRNALVFDGVSDELEPRDLLIRDGLIAEDGAEADEPDQVIDARGGVVTPGFIDAHLHAYAVSLNLLHNETRHLSYTALTARLRLGAALRRGFTTVRDVAGGDAGLHRAIEEGKLESPRYFYTGAALSQTGGHGDPTAVDDTLCFHDGPGLEIVDGVDPLRIAVRARLRGGAHAIKVMASGGVISPADPLKLPQYSLEELLAVSDEATRRDRYVAAHAYSPDAIVHALRGGIRSIEHGNLLDDETAAAMAAADAYLVPTLATYDAMSRHGAALGMTDVGLAKNGEVLEHGRVAIERARAAGVPVGFGTDLMGDLEREQLHGLRLQSEVTGVLELLRSVTSVNAALLREDGLGRIAPGARGDVLVFSGNPLEDPSLLWAERRPRVILDGVPLGEG